MKNHKSSIESISDEFFQKCNSLLEDYGLQKTIEIENIRFREKIKGAKNGTVCRLVKNPKTGKISLVCTKA
jgi:hypothetical protein